MSPQYAFVTLLTSDSYLPGALTLAYALKDVHRNLPPDQQLQYDIVCIVTPETVDVSTPKLLRKVFDVVIGVEVLTNPDDQKLDLLGRPDLDTVLTKLHVLRLTQYSKVIFLDADVLPVRPLSHLFKIEHEFAAAPDVGWPDIFNSGVMALSPGEDKFNQVYDLLNTRGSWDGGDQGILNEWRGDDWHRLRFTYNTTPTASYTYAPAYERFGSQISAIHFIGPNKPWHAIPFRAPGSSAQTSANLKEQQSSAYPPPRAYDYGSLVDRWFNVYDSHCRSQCELPNQAFDIPRYTSIWNQQSNESSQVGESTGFILGLEELRRVAVGGMGSLSACSYGRTSDEGEYRIMPLEGRFHLMRPLTRVEHGQPVQTSLTVSSSDSVGTETLTGFSPPEDEPATPARQVALLSSLSSEMTCLPTPGPNELPAAPHVRLLSLPPTPLHYDPASSRRPSVIAADSPQPQVGMLPTPLSSPPLQWNPAVLSPNNLTPSAPQTTTYFSNIWGHYRAGSGSPTPLPVMFSVTGDASASNLGVVQSKIALSRTESLEEPAATDKQHLLLRQGSYCNDTSEEGSPVPDPTKVKRVFAWEEREFAPRRVFPEDKASPSNTLSPLHLSATTATQYTPNRGVIPQSAKPSPLGDIFYKANAWDYMPHSRKFSLKARPGSKSSVPTSRLKSHQLLEAESQDGDVEDECDAESANEEQLPGECVVMHNVGGVWYRSVGVQTYPRAGVRVAVDPLKMTSRSREVSTSSQRPGFLATGSNVFPSLLVEDVPEPHVHRPFASSRIMISQGVSATPGDAGPIPSSTPLDTPTRLPPISKHRMGGLSASSRLHVSDVSTSPSLHGARPVTPTRKGSRIWEFARDVEVVKRASEAAISRLSGVQHGE
ncbi:glycosyltransferase family 8 protein [Pisolithus tinctorius Marx 270]|uniref:glycogenin glucosyltransferase n=1 Tax=Pisolithus tinctorius Marx 270 TaxID=870435 RepID=A0A0C3JHR2_PISTI|nr:glycosyltransferase family 8 protein [Pisolithus tinctorius Marx 270]